MRRILKNASLLLTLFIVVFGFQSVVKAACPSNYVQKNTKEWGLVCATGTSTGSDNYIEGISTVIYQKQYNSGPYQLKGMRDYYALKVAGTSGDTYYYLHDVKNFYGGGTSALYCLDAGATGYQKLYANRILLEGSTPGGLTYAYDTAIMYVLVNGESSNVNSEFYVSASIAIRALTELWGYQLATCTTNLCKAYAGQAKQWMSDPTIKSYYEALGLTPSGSNTYYFSVIGSNAIGTNIMNEAKRLFMGALGEAVESVKNAGKRATITDKTTTSEEVELQADAIGQPVAVDITHSFTLKNFTNDGKASFKITDLSYVNDKSQLQVEKDPTIISITINGNNIPVNMANSNLLEYYKNNYGAITDDMKVEIKVRFEGYKTVNDPSSPVLKCGQQPMEYNLKFSFGDTSLTGNKYSKYVGIRWSSHKVSSNVGRDYYQRFYSLATLETNSSTEKSDESTDSFNGNVSLVDECSCTQLEEACKIEANQTGNLNGAACKELIDSNCGECSLLKIRCDMFGDQDACTKADTVCDFTCETDFSTFECCEDNLLMVSEMDNKEVSILGPGPENTKSDNIKACFVSKIDEQCDANDGSCTNTEITDQKDNSHSLNVMNDNKYCTVSCKEDYKMTMPTARIVNAGRYFTFKAKIEGTKSCYTNTINREQYKTDIIEAQERLIKAYNNYQFWLAASKATPQANNSSCPNCSSSTPYIQSHSVSTTAPAITYTIKQTNGGYGDDIVITNYNATQPVDVTSPETNYCTGATTCSCTPPAGSTSCTPPVVSPTPTTNDTLASLKDYIATSLSTAESEVTAAEDNYHKIIDTFKQCTDDTWSSKMNYDPNVYYDYAEDYLNKYNKNGEMDRNAYTETTDSEQWFCSGENTINNDYTTCTTGARYSRSSTLATKTYIYCEKDKCYVETNSNYNQVSEASYVKKVSTISASYRPATLFYNVYPSGEIVINSADNNVPIENGLPVSLGTARGIYKYTVNIENLGEFYKDAGSDNLGRYVGSETAIVDPAKLVYNCAYLVNIPKTDGWICDFDDTCDDDCISNCIGPNCPGYCDGDDCVADCIGLGCIYDSSAGTSMIERTVSLSNLFPNGTTSYNWNSDENEKAQVTITEIENKGNSVYDEAPILSITLDPSTAREIKVYNNSVENDGGYSNQTISCYALDGYQEIACYSDFISALLDGTYGRNVVNSKSLIAQANYRTVSDNNKGYFTLWGGSIFEQNMIGPSWK